MLCATAIALPAQTFTTIFSFGETGSTPNAGLVQGTNGHFYGTTAYGGNGGGCPFPNIGCGTLFKITPGGAPTTLYSFCSQIGCPDGEYPYAGLIQATKRVHDPSAGLRQGNVRARNPQV